jgi:hypothetical protein
VSSCLNSSSHSLLASDCFSEVEGIPPSKFWPSDSRSLCSKRKRPRPRLNPLDRLFWTALRQCWSRWTEVLVIVKPDTVIGWHRAGFRLFWRWRSRPRGGRPKISREIRTLIQRLAQENRDWGAPKIHGELQKPGFVIAERSVARYLRRIRRRGDPARLWLTFLQNHREVIAAFDFFTVPTVTFQLLYCFFVIEHGRRRILHFNVTRHPTAEWVVQQLREAFPEAGLYRYVIFDHDSTFNSDVIKFLKATGLEPKTNERTSTLAEWNRGAMGGKLPARDPRSRDRHQRTPSSSADARLCKLPSRRSNSRWPQQRHTQSQTDRAKALS